MNRQALTIDALFTLAGVGFGLCTGMLFFNDDFDPSRVMIHVGVLAAITGAGGGLVAIRLLRALIRDRGVFELVAIPLGTTLLAFSTGMAVGWTIGSNVIGHAAARQEAALKNMRAIGCIGATLGLLVSAVQIAFDWIRSRKVRAALVTLWITSGLACLGALCAFLVGQAEGDDLHERLRNGRAAVIYGACCGALVGLLLGTALSLGRTAPKPNVTPDP